MDFVIGFVSFVIESLVFGIAAWLILTWLVSRYLERQMVYTVARDLEHERLIPLTVEVDNNQYFCYNSIDKAFVCQGHSLAEIVEKFKQRYPDKSAAIYDGDETAVRTLKAQLKDLDEKRNSIRHPS